MESAFSLTVHAAKKPAAGFQTDADSRWIAMLRLVATEYPYCTMHGVHIEDGCVVACEGIQRSFVFDGSAAAPTEPAFDGHWMAFKELCRKLGYGRLAELRFSRGQPVSARVNEGGRRFRKLIAKAKKEKPSPMS